MFVYSAKYKVRIYSRKFMFIILSIYSKNSDSLANFLKFFYKLKKKNFWKSILYTKQSQKKKSFSIISVLQSPHVNKKSQEQFNYYVHTKQLRIHVNQLALFLFIWKRIKMQLFVDVKLKTNFLLDKNLTHVFTFDEVISDRFFTIFLKTFRVNRPKTKKRKFARKAPKKTTYFSYITNLTFLKLIDVYGETLLKKSIRGAEKKIL